MNNALKIKDALANDFKSIAKLHRKYYGNLRNERTFRWQYKSLHKENSVFVTLNENNEVVGTQGMIPIYLNIGGKKWLTGKSESTLLERHFRGKAFFEQMYESAIEKCTQNGMGCIWGFTTAEKAFRKVNFKVYQKCLRYAFLPMHYKAAAYELKKRSPSNSKIRRVIFAFSLCLLVLYSKTCRVLAGLIFKNLGNKCKVEKELKHPVDMDRLFEHLHKQYPALIHIHQDPVYVSWRIRNNPLSDVICFYAYAGEAFMGYLYITLNSSTTEITDFTFYERSTGHFLLQEMFKYINQGKGIGFISYKGNRYNLFNQNVFNLLKLYGFSSWMAPTLFVLRNLSYPDGKELSNIRNWYITNLWSEGV
jgi:hypothetical protein